MFKINYGCGETKFKDYINIDIEEKVNPDLILDLRQRPFPYEDESIENIICSHNIEHIEFRFWDTIFSEFHRVLIKTGSLILAYPEFAICAKNFIENYKGMKEYWRATLYGRQLYLGDYHVTPVVTKELIAILTTHGFRDINVVDDREGPHYKVLSCVKLAQRVTHEDVVRNEIFK
jgi:hypothetical protein